MLVQKYTAEWWRYLSGPSKFQGLDLLRAIAIVAVVLWHFRDTGVRIGWIGVNLFFILSGFLIGTILLKNFDARRFSYWGYFSSRLLRIYPLYAVAVGCYLLQMCLTGFVTDIGTLSQMAAVHAVFLQTLTYDLWSIDLPFYVVTWSLVVEMVFYVTIPIVLFVLYKIRLVWVGLLAIAAAFLWLRFSISATLHPDDPNWHFYYFLRPYFRYDELLFGVAVAYAAHRGINALRGTLLIAGLL